MNRNDQLIKDSDLAHKFQGYCSKVVCSLEDLPPRAYDQLEACMYPVTESDIQFKVTIGRAKESVQSLWHLARQIEINIHQLGGPRTKPYVSKLTDEEIAERISGNYVHTKIPAPEDFSFSKDQMKDCPLPRSSAKAKMQFFDSVAESINEYRHEKWRGTPNRRDEKDLYKTLSRQIEKVLDSYEKIAQMALSDYKNIDIVTWNIGTDYRGVVDLSHAADEAGRRLEAKFSGQKKPLEFQLADDIAYTYWKTFGSRPTHHPEGRFMLVLAHIEDSAELWDGITRLMGIDLMKRVLRDL